jgi:hypothetical protein
MSPERGFRPVFDFSFEVNRAERAQQVRLLMPLLADPEGRVWLLGHLDCPCTADEARTGESFHFVFPLRDVSARCVWGNSWVSDSAKSSSSVSWWNPHVMSTVSIFKSPT